MSEGTGGLMDGVAWVFPASLLGSASSGVGAGVELCGVWLPLTDGVFSTGPGVGCEEGGYRAGVGP